MFEWLYRYVFRGIGILFVIGLITILILTISFQMHRPVHRQAAPAVAPAKAQEATTSKGHR